MADGDRGLSSFVGRRRQVRGRAGAGCLKSLIPEEHFSRLLGARLRGRAVPCAARCGAAAMRSSFRLFVQPNGLFLFFNSPDTIACPHSLFPLAALLRQPRRHAVRGPVSNILHLQMKNFSCRSQGRCLSLREDSYLYVCRTKL